MSERIKRIADDPGIPVGAVNTFSFDIPLSIISAEDNLLVAISDQDAGAVGLTREGLAANMRKGCIAMEEYREERSLRTIISGILYTVVATVALALILLVLQRLYRKIDANPDSASRPHSLGSDSVFRTSASGSSQGRAVGSR